MERDCAPKVFDVVGSGRPAVAQHAYAFKLRRECRSPVLQQLVEHGIEVLFRWIPGLEQVMIDARFVDRSDRCVSVSVSCQQHTLRIRKESDCLCEEFDARHAGHSLIDQEEGNGIVSDFQLANNLERLVSGTCP
jgi:hypothetical protein